MNPQKVSRISVSGGFPEREAHSLNLVASDGYKFGGLAHLMAAGGGAIYSRSAGTYLDTAIAWLNPSEASSLFRCWRILRRRGEDIADEVQRVVDHENSHGFVLVELMPLDGGAKEGSSPVTVGYFAVFERPGRTSGPMPLDRWTMKEKREITDEGVPCPAIGCGFKAPRMNGNGPNLDSSRDQLGAFLCPHHKILVSPSTFEYEDPQMSLLWHEQGEIELSDFLASEASGKRTWTRRGRERDEDSLTWNVFRYLQRHGLLRSFLDKVIPTAAWWAGSSGTPEKLIYWSVDLEERAVWDKLVEARADLGESTTAGSEPDLILVTSNHVIIIEVKFDAPAVTTTKELKTNYSDEEQARPGGVFTCNVAQAVKQAGYELFRFFLLAEAMGKRLRRKPVVVSLTRKDAEPTLQEDVAGVLKRPESFVHLTWDDVEAFVASEPSASEFERTLLTNYLNGKTRGYDSHGKLQFLLG